MMLFLVVVTGLGLLLVERLWPATALPKVRAWWPRVLVVNGLHFCITLVAGLTLDCWMGVVSLCHVSEKVPDGVAGLLTYLVASFIYFGWHRLRHESKLFWRLCHQLHHSPRRIEIFTAFYKHPIEIVCNSLLSSAIAYPLMGCSVGAAAIYTLLAALAEFFYHWNVHTPRWLGYLIQRPESHRIHHKQYHHAQNYGDLPIFDIIFGTFHNPERFDGPCGFEEEQEDRLEDILLLRDLNDAATQELPPFQFLPTCIGCRKRWACWESRKSVRQLVPSASLQKPEAGKNLKP